MCVADARGTGVENGDAGSGMGVNYKGYGNNYVRDYPVRSHGIKSCNHVVVDWHAEGVAAESQRERERERGTLFNSGLRQESDGRGLTKEPLKREVRPHHLDARMY